MVRLPSKLMIFGSVRFALFETSLKTVRFAFFNENTKHGRLFGAVRLAFKNRNGKRSFFCYGSVKRFSLKNGKWYGFRLRCRDFLIPNRGNGRSRNGTVRYGQGDKFGRTTVLTFIFGRVKRTRC